MAIIDVPAGLGFAEAAWEIDTPFQDNRSVWTSARRGVLLPGAAHWFCTVEFAGVGLGDGAAAPGRAFLAALEGMKNSFRLRAAKDQHTLSVSPQAKAGAIAEQSTMTIKNLPASAVHLPAGYYITVRRPSGKEQMLMLTAPLVANGSGEALAQFKPPLIEAPAADSAVETRDPWCLMSQTTTRVGWRNGRGNSHAFNGLSLEEVV
ncbi:MAG: hypothetical protein DI537_34705 [Stutzerimonas stutzeri]|nr:MAG: hypothetical protein DI537_34705 [Stutzerimonas stutzeri]